MSQQARDLLCLSFTAISAVSQYRAVGFDGAQITTAGARIAGIAKRPAAVGEQFESAAIGTAVAEAGAAFAVGAALEVDAQGRLVTNSSGVHVATALQAASAAGQCVEVLLSL